MLQFEKHTQTHRNVYYIQKQREIQCKSFSREQCWLGQHLDSHHNTDVSLELLDNQTFYHTGDSGTASLLYEHADVP